MTCMNTYINNVVNSILVLNSDTRIAIAHRLLMGLEEKKDITRWQFWDRQSVKEHGQELADRTLTDTEVTDIMDALTKDWNASVTSLQETDIFTEVVNNSINHS